MQSISSLSPLASLLPGSWAFVPRVYDGQTCLDYAEIKRADGLTIGLSVNRYGSKGMIGVSLCAPRDSKGQSHDIWNKAPATGKLSIPSIKVSESKTPNQIATDIARRLLPDAEVYFVRANEVIAQHNAYYDGKANTLKAICALIGVEPRKDYNRPEEYRYEFPAQVGGQEVDIRISSADSVSIKLDSLNGQSALAFLRMLKEKSC